MTIRIQILSIVAGLSFMLPQLSRADSPAQATCIMKAFVGEKVVHICSGTFIGKTQFLTAAHCVFFGAPYINNGELQTTIQCPNDASEYRVVAGTYHPYFNDTLIKLDDSALPPTVVKAGREAAKVGIGDAINVDVGFLFIDEAHPFEGLTPRLATTSSELNRLKHGRCLLRGFRGDLASDLNSIIVEDQKYLRAITNIRGVKNIRYGLDADVATTGISFGDSGGGVLCSDPLDNSRATIVATVSGLFSPLISLFQNADYIAFAKKLSALPPSALTPSAGNRELLTAKKDFILKAQSVKSSIGLTINCESDSIASVNECVTYLDQIKNIFASDPDVRHFRVQKKKVTFTDYQSYFAAGSVLCDELRFVTKASVPAFKDGKGLVFDAMSLKVFLSSDRCSGR